MIGPLLEIAMKEKKSFEKLQKTELKILPKLILQITPALREKCPNTVFFLVSFFHNRTEYGTEKTPHFDTFHAVQDIMKQLIILITLRTKFVNSKTYFQEQNKPNKTN